MNIKMKVQDLIGPALDYAVGLANGWLIYPKDSVERGTFWHLDPDKAPFGRVMCVGGWSPSTKGDQGMAIIESSKIGFGTDAQSEGWLAFLGDVTDDWMASATGPTALVAAMRCFVASKLGLEVDIPEELQQLKE